MPTEEQQIRALVATWMAATKSGDVETVLGLMTEDAVFLVPGKPAMRKSEFAAAAKAQAMGNAPKFDGASEIQEESNPRVRGTPSPCFIAKAAAGCSLAMPTSLRLRRGRRTDA